MSNTTASNQAVAWDYNTSVATVRGIYFGSYRKVSTDLIETLYQAKLQINRGPGNPHGRYSWKTFCFDAFAASGGPTQRTIDTWLKRHEIGEAAWNDLLATKSKSAPLPKDDDSIFIVKRIVNKDGTYTVRLSLSEYPDTIFEETIVA